MTEQDEYSEDEYCSSTLTSIAKFSYSDRLATHPHVALRCHPHVALRGHHGNSHVTLIQCRCLEGQHACNSPSLCHRNGLSDQ